MKRYKYDVFSVILGGVPFRLMNSNVLDNRKPL